MEQYEAIIEYIRSIPAEDRSEYMDGFMQTCLIHRYEKKRTNVNETKLDTKSGCHSSDDTTTSGRHKNVTNWN